MTTISAHDLDPGNEPTTWAPVDLRSVLDGVGQPPPALLARTDGRCLLYAGRIHAIHGEPESLKSWFALKACAQVLKRATDLPPVFYTDFEDEAESVVGRLRALGVSREQIEARFIYVRPDEPLTGEALADFEKLLTLRPILAVVDGVTEAMTREGLDLGANGDIARWLDLLPRRLANTGAAVLDIDHVVKDKESRGRWALGGQHKMAGVHVAYSTQVVHPFAPGRDGLVVIRVQKDRPGQVRAFQDDDGQVAIMRLSSLPDGAVVIALDPPDPASSGEFRPTARMEDVSKLIESSPGISKTDIRDLVTGRAGVTDKALALLITESYVSVIPKGSAHQHFSLRAYRKADDPTTERAPGGAKEDPPCPPVPTVSQPVPDTAVEPCPRVPP